LGQVLAAGEAGAFRHLDRPLVVRSGKAAKLEARRQTEVPSAEIEGGGPGLTVTLALLAGLLLAGFFVFRRALNRPQA
jgi:hypothetical protein